MSESEASPTASDWRQRLLAWPRRHPYWSALLAFVLIVRIALPYVLRPVLEDQISAALNGRIEIEDVDLGLLIGEFSVEGVRILESESGEPPVAFAKFLANIGWTSFPFGQIVVEELHLLSPTIRVVREADGSLNLERLPAPPAETDPDEAVEPTPEAAEAGEQVEEGWPIGLTRLALEDATISFDDRSVEGFEPVEFHIDLLEIERTAYGGPVFDEQGKVTLVSELAGAPLKIVADFESEITKATSFGNFSATGLNVGLGAPYAAQLLGWRDLQGTLDVDLDFAANEGKTRSPRIVLDLRDFMIAVEGDEQPALTWDSLAIEISSVDLDENFSTFRVFVS